MSDDVVLLVQAQTVNAAEQQIPQRLQRLGARLHIGVRSQEADSQRLLVEAGRVQALVVEATALVDGAVVSNAEVVRDVRPSEHVGVQVLQVTHLGRAGLERVAVLSGGVVHHHPGSGRLRQERVGSDGAAPLRLGQDIRAH